MAAATARTGESRAARSEKALAAAIDAYNAAAASAAHSAAHVELELRLDPVSAEEFGAIRTAATTKYGQPRISRTCNIIATETAAKTRAQSQGIITYTHGTVKLPPSYSTKARLVQPAIVGIGSGLHYRIGVSLESPAAPMRVLTNALLRYKVRYSWEITAENGSVWQLDMTIVKRANVNDGEATLSAIRDEMFVPETPHPEDATYEIEIELVRTHDGRVRLSDFAIVDTVVELIHPDHVNALAYQRAVHEAAVLIGVNNPASYLSPSNRLKQLVPQVEAISRVTFRRLGTIIGHWATLKLDGERCLVHVDGSKCNIILADSVIEFSTDLPMYGNTLADGEIIGCESSAAAATCKDGFTIHLFDVIMINDERSASDISARIASLPLACNEINARLGKAGSSVPKTYVRLDNVERDVTALWESRNGGAAATAATTPVDGIIISEPNKPYLTTQHYKWKPTEQNTIDFMIIRCPDSLSGVAPYVAASPSETTYLLFVGIDHEMRMRLNIGFMRGYREMFPETPGRYYPIQFSPSVNPLAYVWHSTVPDLHGKIGEFSLSGARDCTDCEWVFHRVRNDRRVGTSYYGNNYYVAETIYMNYIDDFPLRELWGGGDDTYFTKTADERYRASNDYKRVVINALFGSQIRDATYVFDAAAGRGADLARYRRIGARTLLAVDIDAAAIAELVDRKYARRAGGNARVVIGGGLYSRFPSIDGTKLLETAGDACSIYAAVIDLSRPADELAARVIRYGCGADTATAFVCNFALHYFCDSEANLLNFLTFAARVCAVGARVVFTVMDGQAVADALTAGPWQIDEGGSVKYLIRYLNAGSGKAKATASAAPTTPGKPTTPSKLTTLSKPTTPAPMAPAPITTADAFGRMIEIKLPFTDRLMTEPLCFVDNVIAVAEHAGFAKVEVGNFSKYSKEFEINNTVMHNQLTDGDRAYIALHSYIVLERVSVKAKAKPVAAAASTTPAATKSGSAPKLAKPRVRVAVAVPPKRATAKK